MVRTDYLNDRPNTPDNPPPTEPLSESIDDNQTKPPPKRPN